MILEQAIKAFESKITGGSGFGWDCLGPDVRYLDFESNFAYGSVLYDTVTFLVYEATVNDKNDKYQYRYIEPTALSKLKQASERRNIDFEKAWDDVKWYDLEVEEDFLEKATAIFTGKSFDKRVQVPIELEDNELLHLALEAHKRDITLNQMVEILLNEAIHNRMASTK